MKLTNIQILRALAAAFVVYVHSLSIYKAKVGITGDNLIPNLDDLGDLGVKLFFCISGFIIFNCASRLPGGVQSSLDFFVKRCIRILPLYYAATSIYALKLAFQGNTPSIRHYLSSIFFIPYADQSGLMRPVLGQGWTLNFEMLFYLLMTLLLLASRSRLRYHALVAVLVLLVVLNHTWLATSNVAVFASLGLITNELLLFFAGGIIVGMSGAKVKLLALRCFGRLAPLVGALVALGVAVFARATLHGQAFEGLLFGVEWACCIFAVFAASLPNEVTHGFKSALLQPVIKAGDGSYSTYLLHGFFAGPAAWLVSFLHINVSMQWFAIAMVIVCSAVGIYCYKYFELPVQHALSDFWNAKKARVWRVFDVARRQRRRRDTGAASK